MPRKKLTLEQRLKAARTLDALYRSTQERGARNEAFAQEICRDFVALGIIKRFWAVPKNSYLDLIKIDIVCETSGGYYFLNVKSSFTGITEHTSSDYRVFPWLAVSYRGPAEAERKLTGILDGSPSCTVLPKEVQAEIDRLIPNIVLLYEPPAIGKRERAVLLDEIAEIEQKEKDRVARIELEEKKKAAKAILSGALNWRYRIVKLKNNNICTIQRWDISNDGQWIAWISIEIFGEIISAHVAAQKKKSAENMAAQRIAEQILALIK